MCTFVAMHKNGGAHMGTLYETLLALCKEKGISGARMCTDIGLSKSLMTGLKKGRRSTVSTDTAQRIADYFGISVDQLLGYGPKEKNSTPEGMELSETQSVALDLIMNMSEDQLKKFIQLAEIALEIPSAK
jgi:transcriptional regulator with XRE-family HTH domain